MSDEAANSRIWEAGEPNFLKQAESQLSELMLSLDYLGDETLVEIFDEAESRFNARARSLRAQAALTTEGE